LKKIGLAIHNYISAYNTLPPSGSRDDDPGGLHRFGIGPRQNAWSMKARILGFYEANADFNNMNFSLDPSWDARGGSEPANATSRGLLLYNFLCPSDPRSDQFQRSGPAPESASSYVNNVGTNRRLNNWVPDGPAYFPGWDRTLSRPLTLADIGDGTANTAIFSETALGDGLPLARSRDGFGMVYVLPGLDPNASLGTGIQGEYLNAQNCQQNARTREFSWKDQRWIAQDPGRGGFYSHTMPPNRRSCSYWGGGLGNDSFETMISASSYHPGGVNLLTLDGSVHFTVDRLDYMLWYVAGTRDGGECINHDVQFFFKQ
jgi:prepilin-type processing-associated H-X9-DG protein